MSKAPDATTGPALFVGKDFVKAGRARLRRGHALLNDHSTDILPAFPTPMTSQIACRLSLLTTLLVGAAARGGAQPHATAPARTLATTADFAWLSGSWEGRLAKMPDAVAEIAFQQPKAGALTGVMRLTQGDKLLVIELISLVDTPRGPEMRFRHFSPTLDAYEPEFKQTMLLKSHQGAKDVFENLVAYDKTLMSTQPRVSTWERRGADEMVAHSDIVGDDGKPDVVVVTSRRRPRP
jgi:hypothetical protein